VEKILFSLLSHLCCLPFDESGLSKWVLVDSLLVQLTNNHEKMTINNHEYIKTEEVLNFIQETYGKYEKKRDLENTVQSLASKLEEVTRLNEAQEEVRQLATLFYTPLGDSKNESRRQRSSCGLRKAGSFS
jgi:hypothetical protein